MRKALTMLKEVLIKERGEKNSILWSFLVNGLIASFLLPNRVRTQLLRLCGIDVNRRASVRAGVIFRSTAVSIGESCLVGYRVLFDVRSGITIGDRVGIGAYTIFVDSDHEMDNPKARAGKGMSKPIVVGAGARVSTQCTVLPGVTIGEGAVVGAGSLVVSDCDPHSLYVGRPARKIRDLPA